tara:strand:- start:93 stop:710 length:618 start_codon:yes stop_codon:yes gene_type:complete
MKEVPFLVKENFLTEEEFSLVVKETEHLFPYLKDGRTTSPATRDGNILKHNKGLFYYDHYENPRVSSPTVNILTKKIFDDDLYREFEPKVIGDMAAGINWTGMLLSYYENGDSYKPHWDSSVVTALYYFDIKPRKFMGGEFCLYDSVRRETPNRMLPFQPVNNRLVAFPGSYMHEVKPVVMSERWMGKGHGRFCISIFCGHNSER